MKGIHVGMALLAMGVFCGCELVAGNGCKKTDADYQQMMALKGVWKFESGLITKTYRLTQMWSFNDSCSLQDDGVAVIWSNKKNFYFMTDNKGTKDGAKDDVSFEFLLDASGDTLSGAAFKIGGKRHRLVGTRLK